MGNENVSEREIARVGQFVVSVIDADGIQWTEVRNVGGTWCLRYRFDSEISLVLRDMAAGDDENVREFLGAWMNTVYLASGVVPDLDFIEGFISSYTGLCGRIAERLAPDAVSDEDNERIVAEEKAYYEAMEDEKKAMEDGEGEADKE